MNKGFRPTTAKIREALFNILSAKIKDALFLDLFAGSGLVGIDAALYGAREVTLVENDYNAVKIIKKNIEKASADNIILVKDDVLRYLKKNSLKFDITFIDAPYGDNTADKALDIIDEKILLSKHGIIVVEHYHKKEFSGKFSNISLFDRRKYGQTVLTFFKQTGRD
ncbi:MAG: 16S rRNA (guanine(966)-N(2))-methyltransferase RsmD [Armatimonadota bacterium]